MGGWYIALIGIAHYIAYMDVWMFVYMFCVLMPYTSELNVQYHPIIQAEAGLIQTPGPE